MTEVLFGRAMGDDRPCEEAESPSTLSYAALRAVLDRAYDQAAHGKGADRHARGQRFEDQPMQQINQLVGVGFSTGQAIKKIQESTRMDRDAAIRELLGSIVYAAGAIVHLESRAPSSSPTAADQETIRKAFEGSRRESSL